MLLSYLFNFLINIHFHYVQHLLLVHMLPYYHIIILLYFYMILLLLERIYFIYIIYFITIYSFLPYSKTPSFLSASNPNGNFKNHFVVFSPKFLIITGFSVVYLTGQFPKSNESGKSN